MDRGNINIKYDESDGAAELANASVVHSRDPGSNLGVDKIFSDSVCISF